MHEERLKSLGRSVRALPLSHSPSLPLSPSLRLSPSLPLSPTLSLSPTLPLSHSPTAWALSFVRHLWRLDELHRRGCKVGEAPLYVLKGGRSATLCVKRWEKRHHLWRLDELHRREVGGHVEAELPRPICGGGALSRARREQSACRLGKAIHLCRVSDRQRECLGRVEHLYKGDKNDKTGRHRRICRDIWTNTDVWNETHMMAEMGRAWHRLGMQMEMFLNQEYE